jgi:hypothetical protein
MPSGDAPNGEKAQTLQRDLGCPASAQKIFRFAFEANQLPLRCVLFRKRGTLAIVTNVGTGRGGRKATSSRVFARGTNGEASVRRSRVVLTPDAGVKSAMMSGVFLGITPATGGWLEPPVRTF